MKKRKTDDLTFVKNGTKESKEFGEGKKPKTPKPVPPNKDEKKDK